MDERTRDNRNASDEFDAPDGFDEFYAFDEYDDDDDAGSDAGSQRLVRVSVWLLSLFIVVILIGIPVLRILDANDGPADRESAIRAAREYVADQFTIASLGERAPRAAGQWTRPSLRDEVDAIVSFLRASDPAVVAAAEAAHAPVSCSTSDPPDSACFQAWLRQPGGMEIIRIEFAVAIFDGAATVVTLRRISVT